MGVTTNFAGTVVGNRVDYLFTVEGKPLAVRAPEQPPAVSAFIRVEVTRDSEADVTYALDCVTVNGGAVRWFKLSDESMPEWIRDLARRAVDHANFRP